MVRIFVRLLAVFACMSLAGTALAVETTGPLRVAAFATDITPPIGTPLVEGMYGPVATIEHPLLAKGVVLQDAGGTYVLCVLDLCTMSNGSYTAMRGRIAEAAGTIPAHVALHEVQQHTAPGLRMDEHRLLEREPTAPQMCTQQYSDQVNSAVTAAVREAMSGLRPATHVGTGMAVVDRVASSRRVRAADGSIIPRYSANKDAALRDLPEGIIDPKLRTVAFYDGDTPLVYLHFYATHPQTISHDNRVSYDIPGISRTRLEQETKTPQIYFSGCGGNVVVGKYNDGTRAAQQALADRLYDGMLRSIAGIRRAPVSPIQWKTVELRLPLRRGDEFSKAASRRAIADATKAGDDRIKAAMNLAWIERADSGPPVDVACLRMGPLRILSLPGDTFVQYQLWSQEICAQEFVAVAGFGDFGMAYLCTDEAYTDRGGYEQTLTFVDPCEALVKKAIADALGAN